MSVSLNGCWGPLNQELAIGKYSFARLDPFLGCWSLRLVKNLLCDIFLAYPKWISNFNLIQFLVDMASHEKLLKVAVSAEKLLTEWMLKTICLFTLEVVPPVQVSSMLMNQYREAYRSLPLVYLCRSHSVSLDYY